MLKATQLAAIAGAMLLCVGTARAAPYAVTVSEGVTNGVSFDTANSNPFSGPNTAAATFTYTGPINFDNTAAQNGPGPGGDLNSTFGFSMSNVSGYSGSGTVAYNSQTVANYTSLSNFLASSGSASGFAYGSYYTFDLGTLAAGTVLSITHDDGAAVFQGSKQIGSSVSGPTTATTDVIDLTTSGDTILRYARENGTPSVLQVSVPEPASLGVLAVSLIGLCSLRRTKRTA